MELIRPFERLGKGDVGIAGGKGASLGEMTQAGISVPPGFVVLAGAFERFIEERHLNQELSSILVTVNKDEMHTVETASEKIQALIIGAEMPEDIAASISENFTHLGAEYVAVRSSATAEDSSSAAWAGQLDTFLNTTSEDLLQNVQCCWASLFTPRAIFYRFEKGMHKDNISVAVVVQKMVQSEVSGIAFSVHPVTEDHNQMIIEAGFGLGEAIVSGQVTPDSFVVEKSPRRIVDKNIAYQSKALWRAEGGGNQWHELDETEGTKPALTDEQVTELAAMVLRIEEHYGFPCDIEWAYEAGTFFITQSRPITTLSPKTPKVGMIEFKKEYTRDTTHIIQQAWTVTLENHRDELGLVAYANTPLVLHYLNDGVIEIWENTRWTPDLMDKMLEKNNAGPGTFEMHIARHLAALEYLKPYWKKGYTDQVDELKAVVDVVFEGMYDFDWLYYPPLDERTPEPIRKRANELREKDVYFDQNDRFIRKSLVAIYPNIRGYEQGVLRAEITDPPSIEVLRERKKNFLVIGEHENFLGSLDLYATLHPNYLFLIEVPPTDATTLVGQVGSKGHAKGRVRIIKRKEQVGEAEEGEVLVSTMTTPDFVPAIRKAVAIVTDEGGITCHAAIIARELEKPCVIGTKFATQVFKDGDMVEVDAEKGIVRKI